MFDAFDPEESRGNKIRGQIPIYEEIPPVKEVEQKEGRRK
jgi:hypothetical protein